MNRLYLFLAAFALGFVAAIPVGGSQIEAAKRAICGHLRAAEMVVLGSVSSDIMYGAIALYGIAPFLESPRVIAFFSAVGAIVLWVLAFVTWRQSKKPFQVSLDSCSLKSKRWAYLTGFSLAVTNLPMILTWLYGAAVAKYLGLADPFSGRLKALFIAGGALGLGGYLSLFSIFIHRIKHFFSVHTLGRIYYWLGVGLFLLSFFFVYKFFRYLSKGG
jgi:threonine/homoserine/homoserine lactone efflux protein